MNSKKYKFRDSGGNYFAVWHNGTKVIGIEWSTEKLDMLLRKHLLHKELTMKEVQSIIKNF